MDGDGPPGRRTLRDGTVVGGWVLRANRTMWDLDAHLGSGAPVDHWRLAPSYRVDLVAVGDPVVLWRTGSGRQRPPGGIVAVGRVTAPPAWGLGDPQDPAWRDPAARDAPRPYVGVRLRWDLPTLTPERLRADGLAAVEVFRSPRLGNPLVLDPGEVARVARLAGVGLADW